MALTQKMIVDKIETLIAAGDQDAQTSFASYLREVVLLPEEHITYILDGGRISRFSNHVVRALIDFYKDSIGDEYEESLSLFSDAPYDIENPYKDRKNAYLKTLDVHAFYKAKKLFSDALPHIEIRYQKELAEATRNEVITGLTSMHIVRGITLSNYLVELRKYLKWCKEQGYNVPHLDEVCSIRPKDVDIAHGFSGKIISGPEELASLLQKVVARYPRTGAVAVCAWLGFSIQEVVDLLDTDVELPVIHTNFFGDICVPDSLVYYLETYRSIMAQSGKKTALSPYYIKAQVLNTNNKSGKISPASIAQYLNPLKKACKDGSDIDYNVTWEGLRTAGAMWRLHQKSRLRELTPDDYYYEARAKTRTPTTFRKLRGVYLMYIKTYRK